MKAAICTKYGPPEVLQIQTVTKPSPKKNEVLIRVCYTNVTSGDIRIRGFIVPPSYWIPARMMLGIFKPRYPIIGTIFSGEIVEIGSNVKKFDIGDKVFGSKEHAGGTYAEYITIEEDKSIVNIPEGFSFKEAAAIVWGGGTSNYFLTQGNIKQGDEVMIYGASGSLGTAAVQIAKSLGATVTGVCSGANVDLVKSLGADKVIDYKKIDFTKQGIKYDVIFDSVGKSDIQGSINSLKHNGIYIHAVAAPSNELKIKVALRGTNKKYIGGTPTVNKAFIDKIKSLAEEGVLKPVIDREYTFEEIIEAHRYVEKGHKKGNVLIAFAEETAF
jgi:NADPH:quinone reductase-like Zn-dependent oxidoreductase